MLPPQALLTALLTIQFVQSVNNTIVTPTPTLSTKPSNSNNITTPSAVANSMTSIRATPGGASPTVHVGGASGGTTVSSTKSGAHSVDQSASVSVAYSKNTKVV